MITLKFGSFTDIKSGFFSKKTTLIVVLIHVYNKETSQPGITQKKHIFVHPKMFYY